MRNVRSIFSSLIFCGFCISCTGSTPTETTLTETITSTLQYVTASITPTGTISSPTLISLPACDPYRTDYCIVEGTFRLQVPIPESGLITVDRSYPYGSTSGGSRNPHLGVEFYNPSGTSVLAAGDGTVVFAGDDSTTLFNTAPNIYGNLIVLKHTLDPQHLYSLYAHLSKIEVSSGQEISKGEKIGEVGSSGASIGSHLHFELRLDYMDNTTTVNPELWLYPLPGNGVLAMQFTDESGDYLPIRTNIQYFPDRSDVFTSAWQPEPYSPDFIHAYVWENMALGNLNEGWYRISYIWNGVLFDRWVEIKEGKLTRASFIVP